MTANQGFIGPAPWNTRQVNDERRSTCTSAVDCWRWSSSSSCSSGSS